MKKKKSSPRSFKKRQIKQKLLPKKKVKKSSYTDLYGIAIIILLGTIIYSNSFNCSFHLDDTRSIVDNVSIRNLSDVKAIWEYSQTRFISYYSFAINYHFGELNVWGYHFVNLLIHLINACLVYWFTLLYFLLVCLRIMLSVKTKKLLPLLRLCYLYQILWPPNP